MILQNKILWVDFADEDGLAVRFDRTGTVRQVRLPDGKTFCTRESLPNGPGGCFLKPGVGFLRKEADIPYSFGDKYPLVDRGRITQESGDDWVRVTWEIAPQNGYACRVEKHITLKDNSIHTAYHMVNTGEKAFAITEYCHNFVSLGGAVFPGDHQLTLITDDGREEKSCLMKSDVDSAYHTLDKEQCRKLRGWILSNDYGALSETVDFPIWKMAVWTVPHVSSSEIFYRIDLRPGEQTSWSRTHRFSSDTL